jgi:hypothetical protein
MHCAWLGTGTVLQSLFEARPVNVTNTAPVGFRLPRRAPTPIGPATAAVAIIPGKSPVNKYRRNRRTAFDRTASDSANHLMAVAQYSFVVFVEALSQYLLDLG